jgi:hypothetical protein
VESQGRRHPRKINAARAALAVAQSGFSSLLGARCWTGDRESADSLVEGTGFELVWGFSSTPRSCAHLRRAARSPEWALSLSEYRQDHCPESQPRAAILRSPGEDNDLQLTNAQRVYDVLTQVETTIAGRPDEVHLVSTMIDNPWFVHAMRIDDHTYYWLSELRLCMTEIDSSTLVDLTGRWAPAIRAQTHSAGLFAK